MTVVRAGQGAVLLENGEVLVAGGSSSTGVTAAAEPYNSSTGTFTVTGSMNDARDQAQLTLLQNGEALIAGDPEGDAGCTRSFSRMADGP